MKILKHHEVEALNADLELMGWTGRDGYRIYRFIKCGHLQEIHTGHVRNKTLACKQCLLDKHAAEATSAGFTLLGPAIAHNRTYRRYRCNGCGSEREYQVSGIRGNTARCWVCKPAASGGGSR